MDWMKQFSRRSFWWILLWNTLLCAGLYAFFWLILDKMIALCTNVMFIQAGEMPVMMLHELIDELESFRIFGALAVFGLALVFSLLLWTSLGRSLRKLSGSQIDDKKKSKEKKASPAKNARQQVLDDQRRVLHLFAMLQRNGRLMDFFAEDLSQFNDAQIGAAARGVQESCKKLIEKHLKPSPVFSGKQGDEVTVDSGFDLASVNLIGNVVGDPPFKGVLRHCGWRAARFDMPSLVTQGDPRLIAPAEVEIE